MILNWWLKKIWNENQSKVSNYNSYNENLGKLEMFYLYLSN
jgi:hypothetical protein